MVLLVNKRFITALIVFVAGFFYVNLRYEFPEIMYPSQPNPGVESTRPIIKGFHGIPWYASRSLIIEKMGKPSKKRKIFEETGNPGHELIYRDRQAFGVSALVIFMVHPGEGLLKGMYLIPYGRGNDCLKTFKSVRTKIRKQFPSLIGGKVRHKTMDIPFCNAIQVGKATIASKWEDPFSNVELTILLGEINRDKIFVIYEKDEFSRWGSE